MFMTKTNYQKEMEKIIEHIEGKPSILLHSCCAPCSSFCLEYLSNFFQITVLFYNPNIDGKEEFQKRLDEQKKLIQDMALNIELIEKCYNPHEYLNCIKGDEHLPEGSFRCHKCYELRMEETAKVAKELGFDFFTTTLSISPLKNALWINEIGEALQQKYDIAFLPSDFKKKGGYLQSIELSKKYNLYRQNYCGCSFSKK